MHKKIPYRITKSNEEIKSLIIKLQDKLSDDNFSDFCNIVISRASKCWQKGLEDYPFGEKHYGPGQSKKTILEIFGIDTSLGSYASYDYSYRLYITESICLYHKIYQREKKLNRILNE